MTTTRERSELEGVKNLNFNPTLENTHKFRLMITRARHFKNPNQNPRNQRTTRRKSFHISSALAYISIYKLLCVYTYFKFSSREASCRFFPQTITLIQMSSSQPLKIRHSPSIFILLTHFVPHTTIYSTYIQLPYSGYSFHNPHHSPPPNPPHYRPYKQCLCKFYHLKYPRMFQTLTPYLLL